MTGRELQDLMARERLTFTTVKLRIQCIVNHPIRDNSLRNWIRVDADLPPEITERALTHTHTEGVSIFA